MNFWFQRATRNLYSKSLTHHTITSKHNGIATRGIFHYPLSIHTNNYNTHIFLLNDYSWEANVSPEWQLPHQCNQMAKLHVGNGLSWLSMEQGILDEPEKPCLDEYNLSLIKQQIQSNIESDSVLVLSVGFADCIHDELLQATFDKNITLVSSSLNAIPYLLGNTLIITYDGQLLNRYMTIKDYGKNRWLQEFNTKNISILGFEDIDSEYQRLIYQSCVISAEQHNLFLQQLALKTFEYVNESNHKIDNIVIECTTIMQIVPLLKDLIPSVSIIGITEAIEIILNNTKS